tara:strand:+ start:918 stop:1568 length:651 start_codon:yes stop_codon:yes gene_type:complete
MNIYQSNKLQDLENFDEYSAQLGIIERSMPVGVDAFFQKLMRSHFKFSGEVSKDAAFLDIRNILNKEFSQEIKAELLYDEWLEDMAEVCKTFCVLEKIEAVSFHLGTQRACRRYHIDNVPKRMLVTYAGKGTEWLPDEAADREAFLSGEPNEKIIKDPSALQFINQWDVAVFRGGPEGVLHRTPDAALNGPSILMKLDHPEFLKNIIPGIEIFEEY